MPAPVLHFYLAAFGCGLVLGLCPFLHPRARRLPEGPVRGLLLRLTLAGVVLYFPLLTLFT